MNHTSVEQIYPVCLQGKEIYPFLKHRYPFLMIDSIQITSGKTCTAIHNVSFSDQCFIGHFPGHPVMPGVLQIEAMAQAACVLCNYNDRDSDLEKLTLFASIDKVKFHQQVVPGDILRIEVTELGSINGIGKFQAYAYVADKKVIEGQFMAALKPTEEYTLAIIKPNAFENRAHIQHILEYNGLQIAKSINHETNIASPAYKIAQWTKEDAQKFYAEHAERPFFNDLCDFMSSGKMVLMVLKGADAVLKWRNLMGATNPANAADGTIRSLYGESIDYNAVHGSDSVGSAKREIELCFPGKFKV